MFFLAVGLGCRRPELFLKRDFLRQVELMEIVAAAVAEGKEVDYSTAAADGKAAEPVGDTVNHLMVLPEHGVGKPRQRCFLFHPDEFLEQEASRESFCPENLGDPRGSCVAEIHPSDLDSLRLWVLVP